MYYFITTFGPASWEQCGYVLGGPVAEWEDEKCHRLDLIHFCIYWTLRYTWAKAATALMRFRTCPVVIVRCREIDSYCPVSEDLYTVVDSEQTLRSCHIWSSVTCLARGWLSIEVVYLQRCLVVTWLIPHETAAVSAHVLCTPCNHAPVYNVVSCKATYIGCRCVQL